MNFSSFPPLMHSPQIMSAHHLQPSPFTPDQFLTHPSPSMPASPEHHSESNAESSDEEMSSRAGFIKKRPLEVTEDLVEGRFETISQRLRRCKNHRVVPRGYAEPPEFGFAPAMGVEPTTPPNRPQSPLSFVSHDMTLSRDVERFRHSPQSRRNPKSRRSAKVKRSCTVASSRKTHSRESSPALIRSRSPLGRWTPPAVSAIQLFSVEHPELPTTPPPRSNSSYLINPPPHVWTNAFPWTVTSPSTSPYPSHSPPSHPEH